MTELPKRSPFIDLREALGKHGNQGTGSTRRTGASVRVDSNRLRRTGIPEVVFAGSKSSDDVLEALRRLVEANGRALASRVRAEDVG